MQKKYSFVKLLISAISLSTLVSDCVCNKMPSPKKKVEAPNYEEVKTDVGKALSDIPPSGTGSISEAKNAMKGFSSKSVSEQVSALDKADKVYQKLAEPLYSKAKEGMKTLAENINSGAYGTDEKGFTDFCNDMTNFMRQMGETSKKILDANPDLAEMDKELENIMKDPSKLDPQVKTKLKELIKNNIKPMLPNAILLGEALGTHFFGRIKDVKAKAKFMEFKNMTQQQKEDFVLEGIYYS